MFKNFQQICFKIDRLIQFSSGDDWDSRKRTKRLIPTDQKDANATN